MKDIFKKIAESPFTILLISIFLLFFHVYPAFLLEKADIFIRDSFWFQLSASISAFIILFLFPVYIWKYFLKKNPEYFGLLIPEKLHEAKKLTSGIILISIPIIILLAKQSSFQEYYAVQQNVFIFLALTITSAVYYFSEEFLFRGFLFFGLWNRFKYHTFWITNVIFAMFHIGKPPLEVFFAFSLGLVLSYTSFKTKSFIPAAIIHFAVALILNILVTYVFTPTNPVNLVMPF